MLFRIAYLNGPLISRRDLNRPLDEAPVVWEREEAVEGWEQAVAQAVAIHQRLGHSISWIESEHGVVMDTASFDRMISDWKHGLRQTAPYFSATSGVALPRIRKPVEVREYGQTAGVRVAYVVEGCEPPEPATDAHWREEAFDEEAAMQERPMRLALGRARLIGHVTESL